MGGNVAFEFDDPVLIFGDVDDPEDVVSRADHVGVDPQQLISGAEPGVVGGRSRLHVHDHHSAAARLFPFFGVFFPIATFRLVPRVPTSDNFIH